MNNLEAVRESFSQLISLLEEKEVLPSRIWFNQTSKWKVGLKCCLLEGIFGPLLRRCFITHWRHRCKKPHVLMGWLTYLSPLGQGPHICWFSSRWTKVLQEIRFSPLFVKLISYMISYMLFISWLSCGVCVKFMMYGPIHISYNGSKSKHSFSTFMENTLLYYILYYCIFYY